MAHKLTIVGTNLANQKLSCLQFNECCLHILIARAVFPPKGGTMPLPHPLISKFMLKNTVLLNIVDQMSCITDTLPHP